MNTQIYEFVVVFSPELSEQELTRKQDAILDLIKKHEGQVGSVEVWGRKTLAYQIKSFSEAFYVFYTITMAKDRVSEFERETRLMEGLIRYLLVKQDKKSEPSAEQTKKEEAPAEKE